MTAPTGSNNLPQNVAAASAGFAAQQRQTAAEFERWQSECAAAHNAGNSARVAECLANMNRIAMASFRDRCGLQTQNVTLIHRYNEAQRRNRQLEEELNATGRENEQRAADFNEFLRGRTAGDRADGTNADAFRSVESVSWKDRLRMYGAIALEYLSQGWPYIRSIIAGAITLTGFSLSIYQATR